MKFSVESTESAGTMVIIPFDNEDDARMFAADIESHSRSAIVTRGRPRRWFAEGQAGTELTFEGWRAKIAAGGTVVITDRAQRNAL